MLACACLMFSTHLRNDDLRARAPAGQLVTEDAATGIVTMMPIPLPG